MKRLITSVGSTLLLAALVIGSPTALLAWGRLDGLARLSPSALMGPDDGTIVLGLVTVTGWAAWFVFTLSVVIEAVALATHSRVHVTLPGLSLVQGLAAGLLVASLAILAPAARGSSPTQQNTTVAAVGIAQQTRGDSMLQEDVPGRSETSGSISQEVRGSQNRPMEFTDYDSARASGACPKDDCRIHAWLRHVSNQCHGRPVEPRGACLRRGNCLAPDCQSQPRDGCAASASG